MMQNCDSPLHAKRVESKQLITCSLCEGAVSDNAVGDGKDLMDQPVLYLHSQGLKDLIFVFLP